MRQERYAVFQVTNNHGISRLICVRGASFGEGAHFEAEFRKCCGAWLHIIFLGRFDQIESVPDLSQACELLTQGSPPLMMLTEPTVYHGRI